MGWKHALGISVILCLFKFDIAAAGNPVRRKVTSDDPVVQTKYGSVLGKRAKDKLGREYEAYLGVPYGSAPTGQRRWKRAYPPAAWNGVHNATQFGTHCTHVAALVYIFIGLSPDSGEDCLVLNVYVPGRTSSHRTKKLPVMVWFYGGAWILGTAAMYPGMDLALNGDVIVVGVNYRIGVMGFLASKTPNAPGNAGLWDINLSLQWIKDNIANFGGDPKQVTIFGASAGAAASSLTMLSPHNKGLFQRAILQSGSSVAFFSHTNRYSQALENLASWFFCDWSEDHGDMVECLREEDAHDLDLWSLVSALFAQRLSLFLPIIDGNLLPKSPLDLYEDGVTKYIDLLLGSNHHDAAGFVLLNVLGMSFNGSLNLAADKAILETLLSLLSKVAFNDWETAVAAIKVKYPDLDSDEIDRRTKAAVKATTDWFFEANAHLEAKLHSRASGMAGRTFKFDYRYRNSFFGYLPWVNGSHIDEMYSVLGDVFMETFRKNFLDTHEFTKTDKIVSDIVQTYWTNFAVSGDPNKGKPVKVRWPNYVEGANQYIEIAGNMGPASVKKETKDQLDRYKFWTDLMPTFGRTKSAQCPQTKTLNSGIKYSVKDIENAAQKATSFVDEWFSRSPVVTATMKAKIWKVASKLMDRRNKNQRPRNTKRHLKNSQGL